MTTCPLCGHENVASARFCNGCGMRLAAEQDQRRNISNYRAAYSDARITVDDQIAEGDKVATRWTGRGKHDGDLGVAPTDKQVKVSGRTLSRLANGKVVEEYTNWDTFGMMQQLGIVPELAHA